MCSFTQVSCIWHYTPYADRNDPNVLILARVFFVLLIAFITLKLFLRLFPTQIFNGKVGFSAIGLESMINFCSKNVSPSIECFVEYL
jgi:galactitol-specific phosphotransferase system IIC component